MIFNADPLRDKGLVPDKMPAGDDQSETALEAALCRLDLERAMSALMTGALERIANGNYGRCVRCSAKIAPERLRALPWVRMCGDCQDADIAIGI